MVNRVADLPLALIVAARDDEPDELLTRIALHAVDDTRHAAAADRGGGRDSSRRAERGAAVHEATGGNPFYVHALLAEDDGRRRAPVVDSIALRLASGCPPACTALARAMAVAGCRRDDRGAARGPRRARRGRGRRGARRRRASCAATTSPTRSCARPSTRRSARGSARAARRGRTAGCVRPPERVAAQVMAAGPGGGVWAAHALRAAAPARVGPRRARGRRRRSCAARPRRSCRAASSSRCCVSSPAR